MKAEKELTSSTEAPAFTTPVTVAATPAITQLPDGYLKDGYHAVTEKGLRYLRPEYVRDYAKIIADQLSGMKPADFNIMIRELKRSKKGTLPFEARKTALFELHPKAKTLIRRHRAPQTLDDLIEANIAAVESDDDWAYMYRHLEAIAGYLAPAMV